MIDLQLYGCNWIKLNSELFHFHIIMRNVPVSLLFSYCYCSIASDVVRHFLLNHHHHLSRAIILPHIFMMIIFIYPFVCFCFWFNSPCVFITSKNKHKHTLFVLLFFFFNRFVIHQNCLCSRNVIRKMCTSNRQPKRNGT